MDEAERTKIAQKVLDPNTLKHEITPLYTDPSLRWRRTVVLPFGGAYKAAYDSFEAAVKEQARQKEEMEKLKFEFAMAALAIAGGSLLTALYGTASMKAIGKEQLLDQVCKRNMEKTFEVMHFAESNATASFITGQIWDKVEAQGLASLKAKLEPKTGQYMSLIQTKNKPEQVLENMEKFNLELREKGIDFILAVRKAPLPDAAKMFLVKEALKSAYLNPPKTELDKAKLTPKIELTLLMQLLTNSDKKYFTKIGPSRNRARFLGVKSQPRYFYRDVPQSANSSKYPEKSGDSTYAKGTMYEYEGLRMPGVGNSIMKHIDAVHRKVHPNKNFFRTGEYYEWEFNDSEVTSIVKRAEKSLKDLGDLTVKSMIKH